MQDVDYLGWSSPGFVQGPLTADVQYNAVQGPNFLNEMEMEMEMDELLRARDFEIILLPLNTEGTQKGSLYFCL